MSKKNTILVMEKLTNMIQNLSEQQFEMLLADRATLKYEELGSFSQNYINLTTDIEKQGKSLEDLKKILQTAFPTKKDYLPFCNDLKIPIQSKDSKETIINKIASHFGIEKNAERNEQQKNYQLDEMDRLREINIIGETLQKLENIQDGKKFITNHKLLPLKKDIILLAKTLDVPINSKLSKKELVNRIVESVIGSKIRSMVLRGETND